MCTQLDASSGGIETTSDGHRIVDLEKEKTTQNTKFELDKCASRMEGVTLQDTGV